MAQPARESDDSGHLSRYRARTGSRHELFRQRMGNLANCTKPVCAREQVWQVQQRHVRRDPGAQSLQMGDTVAPDRDCEPGCCEHVFDQLARRLEIAGHKVERRGAGELVEDKLLGAAEELGQDAVRHYTAR